MQKDNIEAIYPLTPVQAGMLFHATFDEKTAVYEESLQFEINGRFHAPAFKQAWQQVVDRHPVLRTFFVWKNRESPLQIVAKQMALPWTELDWTDQTAAEQRDSLARLAESELAHGFDLSAPPLLRLTLVQLADDRHHFLWRYHHIILDGWSIDTILDEVFTIYQAIQENRPPALSTLQPFKTYVGWLQQQDMAAARDFWQEALQDFPAPTPLRLGEETAPPSLQTAVFQSQSIQFSAETTAALQAFARAHRLTLNTLFQGAWALLLSRYSGETDVLFGAAVSGRSVPMAGIEKMVGMFVGSLPVRVQVSPQSTLIPWLQQLQTDQARARQFEYTALQDIQAWSNVRRPQGQALFDAIMSFNNFDFSHTLAEKTPDFEIRDIDYREGSHYPLTILIDPGDGLRLRVNYDGQRFGETAVARLLTHLQTLLAEFVADPERPLAAYSLLTAAEKQSLLVDFNDTDTQTPAGKTVVQLFEAQAAAAPDAVALRFDGQTMTYAALNERANQLAHFLQSCGIGPEKVVALFLERSPEAVIAILGTLKAGGAYMPIDATLPANRQQLMLTETQAPVILTRSRQRAGLPQADAKIICLDTDWADIAPQPADNLPAAAAPDNLAYIIYTSGSTGTPKGAMLRHRNLFNYISWAKAFYLQGEKLDFPLFSSLSFDLTITSIFVPLVAGSSIVVYGESETDGLIVLDVIKDNLVDIIKLTPAHLSLIKEIDLQQTRVRKMIVGGEDFKRGLAARIHELFGGNIEIYNEYGPTEATVGCMIHRFDPDTDQEASVPIGRPIDNAQIYIMDEHLNPVPPGVVGEMCIGGAGVARGYLQRPELTAAKFVHNPLQPGTVLYRTGDLARWTAVHQMQFLGRADHQVKVNGYRVELGEIENNLLAHPHVKAAVVTVVQGQTATKKAETQKCVQCGLPDNYPGATFDDAGVCSTCRDYNALKERFQPYFRTEEDLWRIVADAKQNHRGKYDCMVLYSGGKDSSYMLYQLVRKYGLNPLVFSLDNGYISAEAMQNIRHVTDDLGVDLVFGQTPHMNAVFVDSLKRFSNVCDGCFKVIYTLSIKRAHQEGIRHIFTGLSRGQLFETRLSDMFQARIFDPEQIDQTVLAARKAYHRFDDAVTQLMDVEIFQEDRIFNEVQLVDFYRYTDVPLQEMYAYLDQNAPWVRPSDTGRSTNCLINDAGIYIHKKTRGYHNYALPYSWDVRVGHKTRQEAIEDLNDNIDVAAVRQMLAEIGYDESESVRTQLAAYVVADGSLTAAALRDYLGQRIPDYMIPTYIVQLDELPLTPNGKVDRQALPRPEYGRINVTADFVAPDTEVEQALAEIWMDVLNLQEVGIHDNFFELGGDSIATIQVTMRVSKIFQMELLPVALFEKSTIAELAMHIEDLLIAEIEQLSDEEAERLLSGMEA